MVKRLTKKQQGFVKDFIKTGNGLQSALNNYDIKSVNKIDVAKSIASENLTKPYIKDKISSIADSIPDSLLVEKHLELLNVPRKIKSVYKGEIQEVIEELDSHAIGKGLDMAYKIKGTYAPEKIKHSGEIRFGELENLSNEELRQLAESTE